MNQSPKEPKKPVKPVLRKPVVKEGPEVKVIDIVPYGEFWDTFVEKIDEALDDRVGKDGSGIDRTTARVFLSNNSYYGEPDYVVSVSARKFVDSTEELKLLEEKAAIKYQKDMDKYKKNLEQYELNMVFYRAAVEKQEKEQLQKLKAKYEK